LADPLGEHRLADGTGTSFIVGWKVGIALCRSVPTRERAYSSRYFLL